MSGSMLIISTIATSAPEFAEKVLGNIVNWEFVGQNLDGDGVARADQGARALADA